MPPRVTTERRDFQAGDGKALDGTGGRAGDNRHQHGERPAIAEAGRIGADGKAVLQAALGDRGRGQAGERDQGAYREVDAGGEDHEGHAERQETVDRDLPHNVDEVEREKEARLQPGEDPPSGPGGRSTARRLPADRTGRCCASRRRRRSRWPYQGSPALRRPDDCG